MQLSPLSPTYTIDEGKRKGVGDGNGMGLFELRI